MKNENKEDAGDACPQYLPWLDWTIQNSLLQDPLKVSL